MEKICSKCSLPKPTEYFSKDSRRKDGLQYWCKECKATSRADLKSARTLARGAHCNQGHFEKYCAQCGEIKPRSEFYLSLITQDGYQYKCKSCAVAYGKAYHAQNPQEAVTRRDRYRARKANVLSERVVSRAVFERDGWVCQICLTPVDPALKRPHVLSAALDHVTPVARGGGHLYSNVQLSHFRCNSMKGTKLMAELELARIRADALR